MPENFTTNLAVTLGRILERSDQTIIQLTHIDKRLDHAENWRAQTGIKITGLHHRMRAMERHQKKHKSEAPKLERWMKNLLAPAVPISLVWLASPNEHGMEVLKALLELMKALKGGN